MTLNNVRLSEENGYPCITFAGRDYWWEVNRTDAEGDGWWLFKWEYTDDEGEKEIECTVSTPYPSLDEALAALTAIVRAAGVVNDDSNHQPLFSGQGGPKYPWEQWFNGQEWELTEGVHFTCSMRSFRATLHHKAREINDGAKDVLRTNVRGNKVYLKYVGLASM